MAAETRSSAHSKRTQRLSVALFGKRTQFGKMN